jgi:biotin operon repressor
VYGIPLGLSIACEVLVPDDGRIYIEDETLRSGFTQIPNAILRRPNLSTGAKLTYMVLLSYAWQKDNCYPGQDTLAADMGVSNRSVITYLQQLQEAGLLYVKRRGLGKTNLYFLPRFNARGENSSLYRNENFAHQEVKKLAAPEVQKLQLKKTQRKSTSIPNNKITQTGNNDPGEHLRVSAERVGTDWTHFFETDNQ